MKREDVIERVSVCVYRGGQPLENGMLLSQERYDRQMQEPRRVLEDGCGRGFDAVSL